MGIKDLFDKGHSLKFVKNKTKQDLREDLESSRFIDEYVEKRNRFIPDVDFTTASNFARFGLAEEYYDTAIKRIYQTYPYDGSSAEKLEWESNSTYLDLFMFENEYPRTNGFITLNSGSHTYTSTAANSVYSSSAPQYIYFKGGPNADPGEDYKSGFSAGPSGTGVSKANIYHTGSQRTNNLELDLTKGVTIEFWMKKDAWAHSSTAKHEYFFNLAASGTAADTANPGKYASLSIRSYGSSATVKKQLLFDIQSGSVSINFEHETGITDDDGIADGKWHHYALTAKTTGSVTIGHLYVDGVHQSVLENANTINAIDGKMIASLGSLAGPLSGSSTGVYAEVGYGNAVRCSFDEFRYWKAERDAQQIGRYHRAQVAGGTNTDNIKYDDISNKVDLGVYFKFNEGITGNSETDSTILDYSGRITNGAFINYNSAESRNTGSAIIDAGAASKEFKDPIIYSAHPDVVALAYNKQLSGSAHDHENSVSLYKSVPGWILEDDEKNSNHLKYLTQILASYFDDLYMQIEKLSRLKDINYPDDTNYEKPLPFADRLLCSRGYDAPELFADASALAKFLNRGEKKLFEKKLYEVKNTIYQNIYNNLSYIQKSKGTFKSLRNFLRCFGVDEELIKLNLYAVDDVYEFKENHTNISVRKKYIDFDDLETRKTADSGTSGAYTATAYQYYDVDDSNSISYIPAISETLMTGAMMTIETEVIFPKRSIVGDSNYKSFPTLSSSIFGLYPVGASNTDLTYTATDDISFNVYASKPDDDLRSVKFWLTGSTVFSSNLSNANSFPAVYNNEKWNLAFRLRPTKMPTDGAILIDSLDDYYSPAASAYTYELYGVNYLSNVMREEFTLSGTMSFTDAAKFFSNPKRLYVGARRENFTGSIQDHSDVKISSTRVWLDYVSDEVIRAHARDPNSYGALHPHKTSDDSFGSRFVPEIKSLVLNWTMDNVTGSDASGRFLIEDFTSGSTLQSHKFGDDWSRPISAYNYTGRGDFFTTNSQYSDQVVDIEFVPSAKQKLPEVVNSDDMVKILNKQDDVVFTRDTTYVQHLLSVEKSMYQTISEEMLRFFATVVDFNNLVGEPVNRYRPNYKKLEKLRELFFLTVENDALDLEKFIEYFKWIDDAVSIMIAQLIPLSSNKVDLLRNMVESHILERNKYWTKFPTLDIKPKEPVASLKAIEELKYNWKFGHAPVSAEENTNQNINCLWWKQRADRDGVLSSGNTSIDTEKNSLLKIAITEVSGTETTLKTPGGTKYSGPYYYNRSLARPIDLVTHKSLKLKGGANPKNNNIHDFYKSVIKWASDDDFIYLDIDNEVKGAVCDDKEVPDELNKKVFNMKALTMKAPQTTDSDAFGQGGENDLKYTDAKSTLLLPFSAYTSSVNSGYQGVYASQFGLEFANIHEDKYGPHAEIPLQGPFTEKYVGGMQHRHTKLNQGSDTQTTRPEGWSLQKFLNIVSPIDWDNYIIYELFWKIDNTVDPTTTGSALLNPPNSDGPYASTWPILANPNEDPSPYEYWENGTNADHKWDFLSGSTPSAGTGPDTSPGIKPSLSSSLGGGFAYCEVLPARVGQTFGLVTPLVDLLDADVSSPTGKSYVVFRYHMHGTGMGNLKVQISKDKTFETGVVDLWTISGQQHTLSTDAWTLADNSGSSYGIDLSEHHGTRFYIRFFYTAGITHLGDCAITDVIVYKLASADDPFEQNSFKLLHPTYDSHHRPYATRTRNTIAKRPVNIRNIHMTGSSPTVAGNYLNRYEYVNTVSPEVNDPWFVKNVDSLAADHKLRYVRGHISSALGEVLPSVLTVITRNQSTGPEYTLPDRTYLTGTVKNKTRIRTRFSSPGGFETLSRGFLDAAHETYSPNNAMTFRNLWPRNVHSTEMQAHCGQFGVSTHRGDLTRFPGHAVATIAVADGDAANGMTELEHITLISTDGTTKRYVITNAASDSSTATGTVLSDADNTDTGAGTAGADEDGGIAVSINLSSATTQNDFLVELKAAIEHANGHAGKITVLDVPTAANGAQAITLVQTAPGPGGNTSLGSANTNISQLTVTTFSNGATPTARVYGTGHDWAAQAGAITIDNYEITGHAAKHKIHRNNIERLKFSSLDADSDFEHQSVVTASVYDNAFVTHMIPRTDNQTRWITGSLI